MTRSRRSISSRVISSGLAAGLVLLLAGDRPGRTAGVVGIDVLEILKLQVKNNVLFIFDTSGSMKWPVDIDNFSVGGDDPMSRMYQAKQAVKAVMLANAGRLNYGLATYNVLGDDKTLNRSQNFDGDGRLDGPFVYVSADASADVYYNDTFCPPDGATRDGFFCRTSDTFGNYDGTTSSEVWQSFTNRNVFDDPYPTGCTPGGGCRYYLQSKLFRNGTRYRWNLASNDNTTRLTATSTVTCPNPPAGLTGENPDSNNDGIADNPRPCIEFENQATGAVSRFYYTSSIFQIASGQSNCAGAAILNTVATCTVDNSGPIINVMQPELPVDSATSLGGTFTANTVTDYTNGDNAPFFGLRADQATPLAGSLNTIRTGAPAFPTAPGAVAGVQKNFVILLTDGDDTCADNDLDRAATAAAREAEALFENTANPRNQAETLVVAFAAAVNLGRANKIAQAGSGGQVQTNGTVSCPSTAECRDAFAARNTEDLVKVLNQALELIVSSGNFSASPPTVATVFELGGSPLDPRTRYNNRVNILYLPTFELPGWRGHLFAFRNDGTFLPVPDPVNFTNTWDAGETLFENISQVMEAQTRNGRQPNRFTFAELHDGATVDNIAVSSALIKRRIFTSSRHGTFTRGTDPEWDSAAPQGRNGVALWPPTQAGLADPSIAVDPAVGTPGVFDDEMGIDVLTFNELLLEFGACDVTADAGSGPFPPDCDNVANPTLALNTARKEARQALLAFLAGARIALGIDGKPIRDVSTSEMLFRDRGWLMWESTNSQPAVVTPPLRSIPNTHQAEWVLFRDGRRNSTGRGINEVDKGFGLRNPDFDDPSPQGLPDLKPVMTVIYFGSNSMLHAVKGESSEELWGFLPYDQLGKVRSMFTGQVRDPHIYVIASSIRVADIFIPGPFTLGGIPYQGRWRTVVFFGRGPGGKFLTALDVTAPGPFTREALDTNPPWVMWNRGNGDGTADFIGMGETWSVPAVGNVQPANPTDPEWFLWTGSGYGTASEGTTMYMIEAITGTISPFGFARDVGDGTPTHFADNALVAGPSAYNPFLLDLPSAATRSVDQVTRVYIPDLHGRVWKFNTTSGGRVRDEGPDQPFGASLALLKLNNEPFVFGNSGNDMRVTPPPAKTPPFKIFGWRDAVVSDSDVSTQLQDTGTFPVDLPDPFRGTNQPASAFNDQGKGRVFFAPTAFFLPGANCLSRFDTLLFALLAVQGGAAYDMNNDGTADAYTTLTDTRATNVQTVGGQVMLGDSGGYGRAPSAPPPPAPMPSPSPPAPAQVVVQAVKFGTPVCRQ